MTCFHSAETFSLLRAVLPFFKIDILRALYVTIQGAEIYFSAIT